VSSHEELLEEIEDTRELLGETVEELAHRLDVKARAEEKIDEVRENAQARVSELGETLQHGGAAAWEQARRIAPRRGARLAALTAGIMLLVLWRRTR